MFIGDLKSSLIRKPIKSTAKWVENDLYGQVLSWQFASTSKS